MTKINHTPPPAKNINPKLAIIKIVAILALVSATVITIAYLVLTRSQEARIKNQVELHQIEKELAQKQLETTHNPETSTYHLLEGWNFVSFPFNPKFTTASELIKHVAINDGYVTTVSQWDGDRWQEFSQRGVEKYGHDFEIKPLTAYFLKNHQEIDWIVTGDPILNPDGTSYELKTGWNTLGLIKPNLKASLVIDAINQLDSTENATVMDWWWSGDWDLYIKRHYSGADIREYGNDFEIKNTRGYMILLNHPANWRP